MITRTQPIVDNYMFEQGTNKQFRQRLLIPTKSTIINTMKGHRLLK